jgi:hypothetical protein
MHSLGEGTGWLIEAGETFRRGAGGGDENGRERQASFLLRVGSYTDGTHCLVNFCIADRSK